MDEHPTHANNGLFRVSKIQAARSKFHTWAGMSALLIVAPRPGTTLGRGVATLGLVLRASFITAVCFCEASAKYYLAG